jgi:hypothetical protein
MLVCRCRLTGNVYSLFRIVVPVAYDYLWADLSPDNFNSEKEFQGRTVFASTQLARLLFGRQLAARCLAAKLPVSVGCIDGGQVRPAYSLWNRLAGGSGQTAASQRSIVETAVQLAVSKELEPGDGRQTGLYYSHCQGWILKKLFNFSLTRTVHRKQMWLFQLLLLHYLTYTNYRHH